MPMVLGVDCAATSTTVELRDVDDGKVFATGRAAPPGDDGATTEQAPTAWWQGLVDARHQAGGALGVAAVAVAAQQQGLVLLDAGHQVLGRAILADDPRGEGEVAAFSTPWVMPPTGRWPSVRSPTRRSRSPSSRSSDGRSLGGSPRSRRSWPRTTG